VFHMFGFPLGQSELGSQFVDAVVIWRPTFATKPPVFAHHRLKIPHRIMPPLDPTFSIADSIDVNRRR